MRIRGWQRIRYVKGCTKSTDFDTTTGAYQATHRGKTNDVFVTKLCAGINMAVSLTSAAGTDNQTQRINVAIINITYATTGIMGIGSATGLPVGVAINWSAEVLTISGTPTESGTFNYNIPLTSGCGSVSATGTITVDVCTQLAKNLPSKSFEVYPNPNNGEFKILTTKKGGVFEIIDVCGKVIRVQEIEARKDT